MYFLRLIFLILVLQIAVYSEIDPSFYRYNYPEIDFLITLEYLEECKENQDEYGGSRCDYLGCAIEGDLFKCLGNEGSEDDIFYFKKLIKFNDSYIIGGYGGNGREDTECGLSSDGDVFCWNLHDERRVITLDQYYPLLYKIKGESLKDIVGVGNGVFICGLNNSDNVKCWKYIKYSQDLAQHFNMKNYIESSKLLENMTVPEEKFSDISSDNNNHICGVTIEGIVKCWGHLKYDFDKLNNFNYEYKLLNTNKNKTCAISTDNIMICLDHKTSDIEKTSYDDFIDAVNNDTGPEFDLDENFDNLIIDFNEISSSLFSLKYGRNKDDSEKEKDYIILLQNVLGLYDKYKYIFKKNSISEFVSNIQNKIDYLENILEEYSTKYDYDNFLIKADLLIRSSNNSKLKSDLQDKKSTMDLIYENINDKIYDLISTISTIDNFYKILLDLEEKSEFLKDARMRKGFIEENGKILYLNRPILEIKERPDMNNFTSSGLSLEGRGTVLNYEDIHYYNNYYWAESDGYFFIFKNGQLLHLISEKDLTIYNTEQRRSSLFSLARIISYIKKIFDSSHDSFNQKYGQILDVLEHIYDEKILKKDINEK